MPIKRYTSNRQYVHKGKWFKFMFLVISDIYFHFTQIVMSKMFESFNSTKVFFKCQWIEIFKITTVPTANEEPYGSQCPLKMEIFSAKLDFSLRSHNLLWLEIFRSENYIPLSMFQSIWRSRNARLESYYMEIELKPTVSVASFAIASLRQDSWIV